jgi:imidazolonepropionase-like amidohydrolase
MKQYSTMLTTLVAIWLAGCGAQDWQATEAEPQPVTILGAKLIDGTGAAPIDDSVVVIEGTRIVAAGTRAETPVPKGGQIIDGAGKIVIPGLIELHAHYFGKSRPRPPLVTGAPTGDLLLSNLN